MTEGMYLYEFNDQLKHSIDHIVSKKGGYPETVIELGVYQGYFTFNMTHLIAPHSPNYRHYSIDPYHGSTDLDDDMIEQAHRCFLHNMSVSPFAKNIEFMRKTSWDGMMDLYHRGVRADLIYVDGDHKAPEVLEDMVLGFKLLKNGGVMLCDDSVSWYHPEPDKSKPLQRSPRLAVDAFIHCNWSRIDVMMLPNGYQSAFMKICEG
jgi:predicted O-methyltransferase YrrM